VSYVKRICAGGGFEWLHPPLGRGRRFRSWIEPDGFAISWQGFPSRSDSKVRRYVANSECAAAFELTAGAPAIRGGGVEFSSVTVEDRADLDRMAPGVADAIARGGRRRSGLRTFGFQPRRERCRDARWKISFRSDWSSFCCLHNLVPI